MSELQKTEAWLKEVFNINRELDFEHENVKTSLKRIEELEQKRQDLFDIISAIKNPTYKSIIHKRYVQGKKWEDISAELCYEYPHIHRLHKKAIEEVKNIRTRQGK